MFTTRPELAGTFGMVASTHWLASQTGMAVLERGGNAFDAAVAAGFVLQVVEPHLNGPAGEVPILAYDTRSARATVICGQGTAPAAASAAAFARLGLSMIPGTGLLPACIPGAFGGWMLLLRRHGTMRPADVLGYAIGYAESGFPLLPRVAATIATVREIFTEHWPTSAETWLPGGKPPPAGTLFTNRRLAATYRRILVEAQAAGSDRDAQIDAALRCFYAGFVAEAVDRFCAGSEVMDVTGRAHAGLLRGSDLAGWRAASEEPLSLDYAARGRVYTVCKAGPWSQAPVFLQQLAILSGCDLDAMGPASADFVHTTVEAGKLAFADREAFYGDPAFVDVPLRALLSAAYNDSRRGLLGERADCGPLRPGSPDGAVPLLPDLPGAALLGRALPGTALPGTALPGTALPGTALPGTALPGTALPGTAGPGAAGPGLGEPAVRIAPARDLAENPSDPVVGADGSTRGDTCHIDVADRWGNMVSATPSGGWLQSSPTIPDLGFCLGTRGQMFWLQGGLANSLAPGKRPRTTLSPSLALRDGAPYLAFGTPGGDQQDQWSLQLFLRHVHHGLNLQQAIDEVAWHSSHVTSSFYPRESHPGRLHIEGRAEQDLVAGLRARGHDVVVEDDWSLGRLSAVSRDPDGVLRAGANPRGMQGYAVGR